MNFTFLPSSRVLTHSFAVISTSLAGIFRLDFRLAHRTPLPPSTQRTCQHSKQQGIDDFRWPSLDKRRSQNVEINFWRSGPILRNEFRRGSRNKSCRRREETLRRQINSDALRNAAQQ